MGFIAKVWQLRTALGGKQSLLLGRTWTRTGKVSVTGHLTLAQSCGLTFVSILGEDAMVRKMYVGWRLFALAQGNGEGEVMASRT